VISFSSSDSSNNVINVKSSKVTRTASGSAGEVSGSNHSVNRTSEGSSYEWVDSCVLNIPTSFRDSNGLDKFLFKIAFIKPDCPLDVVMDDICGHTDRVCHGGENALQDFFFCV